MIHYLSFERLCALQTDVTVKTQQGHYESSFLQSCVQWQGCATNRCGARILSDGHKLWLHHALCMKNFKLYDPWKVPNMCCSHLHLAAVHYDEWLGARTCGGSLPLDKPDQAPFQPLLIGFGCSSQAFPSLSLKALLRDRKPPPPEFPGFQERVATSDSFLLQATSAMPLPATSST